jgi:ribosomal protein L25 (general stress protein Ctc)
MVGAQHILPINSIGVFGASNSKAVRARQRPCASAYGYGLPGLNLRSDRDSLRNLQNGPAPYPGLVCRDVAFAKHNVVLERGSPILRPR